MNVIIRCLYFQCFVHAHNPEYIFYDYDDGDWRISRTAQGLVKDRVLKSFVKTYFNKE